MAKSWLHYWKEDQIQEALELGRLDHIASDQFERVQPGDRIWIVNADRNGHLRTIGFVDARTRLSLSAVRKKKLGYPPFPAQWHFLVPASSATRTRVVSLAKIAGQLRFNSSARPKLTVRNGKVNGQELQALRELLPESAGRLQKAWDSSATLEDQLTEALRDGYRRTGEEVGYWGRRFIQAVGRNGGLETVRRMFQPRNASQRQGLDRILEARRPDLTVEAIVLKRRFRSLFSPEELLSARTRLAAHKREVSRRVPERWYPDELPSGRKYAEGAKKQVWVNSYERDRNARRDCVLAQGYDCVVCGFSFERTYGLLGRQFIHVHHIKAVSRLPDGYKVDPEKDLVPVCPNCHAMLHRPETPLSVEALRKRLRNRASRT